MNIPRERRYPMRPIEHEPDVMLDNGGTWAAGTATVYPTWYASTHTATATANLWRWQGEDT